MAITTGLSISQVAAEILHKTVKENIRLRFREMIEKDIEKQLDDYAKHIVTQVVEMKDPYSMDGLKVKVIFNLPDLKEGANVWK